MTDLVASFCSKSFGILRTLYLVTKSDILPVLVPQTLFCAFSGHSGVFYESRDDPTLALSLSRLPLVIAWIWLNLLVLDLANQRLPASIAEDAVNKPWRPIPARRIDQNEARQLLILFIAATLLVSLVSGSATEALVLFSLNWMYNDLHLADDHWFFRNILNALGITFIGIGAFKVGYGDAGDLKQDIAYIWWTLCGAVLFTTIQGQDLYDQKGDALRGRKTMPLVFGDSFARWSIALPILAWSLILPAWMGPRIWQCFLLPVSSGTLVTFRVLMLRSVDQDRQTFQIWAMWMITLYALPLIKSSI